jgi:NADH:ubiquinone oxidoreductase subunit 6 (subunit J)
MNEALFYILASSTCIFAVACVARPGAVFSVAPLCGFILSTAGLFILMGAALEAFIFASIMGGAAVIMYFFGASAVDSPYLPKKRHAIRFAGIVGMISAIYLTAVLSMAMLRPPFVESPMSGSSFESASIVGNSFLSTHMLHAMVIAAMLICAAVALSVFISCISNRSDPGGQR